MHIPIISKLSKNLYNHRVVQNIQYSLIKLILYTAWVGVKGLQLMIDMKMLLIIVVFTRAWRSRLVTSCLPTSPQPDLHGLTDNCLCDQTEVFLSLHWTPRRREEGELGGWLEAQDTWETLCPGQRRRVWRPHSSAHHPHCPYPGRDTPHGSGPAPGHCVCCSD